MSKNHRLFISHSWNYSDAYEKLVYLLNNRQNFSYTNYSVPKSDPVHTNGTDRELHEAIANKVSQCHVVIILAGVYSSHSKWIQKEIDIAKNGFSTPKKIIAIEPWGSQKTSIIVKENADKIVKWNSESIVSAIKELS
ncbi:MAG: TIR domain-containing protein [Methanolobus sp.]|jgi:hypothetical protein|nr:TIR domain-containing protein [Methanolobus sp.]